MTRIMFVFAWCLTLAACAGCANHAAVNPSFAVTTAQAKAAWQEMASKPSSLERPLIVLGGIYDPGLMANHIASQFRDVAANDNMILHCSFFFEGSFDRCARKLIEKVDEAFPSSDPHQTVEVDVVAFSMGGLVARYAASDLSPSTDGRTLRLSRLFTVGSPHRGAKLAWVPTFDQRIIDMRSESDFIAAMNTEDPAYEIVPYAKLGDEVVGAANAAPPGRAPWWVSRSWFFAHAGGTDIRILADIARRLRGQTPFTIDPPAPLPEPT
jgi:hypothetical protein